MKYADYLRRKFGTININKNELHFKSMTIILNNKFIQNHNYLTHEKYYKYINMNYLKITSIIKNTGTNLDKISKIIYDSETKYKEYYSYIFYFYEILSLL